MSLAKRVYIAYWALWMQLHTVREEYISERQERNG